MIDVLEVEEEVVEGVGHLQLKDGKEKELKICQCSNPCKHNHDNVLEGIHTSYMHTHTYTYKFKCMYKNMCIHSDNMITNTIAYLTSSYLSSLCNGQ